MTESLPVPVRLKDISPKAYEHPADRAATAALKSIPMLDTVVKRLIEFQYERALRQSFLAGSIRLGPDQLPDVWALYERSLATLDMPETYDLYLTADPHPNAAAIGAGKPMIVTSSSLVSLLDPDELRTVFAHEAAHILSQHVLYRTALMILLQISVPRLPIFGNLPLVAVRTALLEWFRASELSCDRASTLVNRDPLVTCRTMMVLAGGSESRRLNLDAFLQQASEYEHWDHGFDRVSRLFVELNLTHDFPVRRASEVMKWVHSGEYDRIVRGDYPTRDDDVDARAEAGEAVEFYAERFRTMFREAGEGVASAGGKLGEWIRGSGVGR
jgi:Zn-dependent protease with chaperone function